MRLRSIIPARYTLHAVTYTYTPLRLVYLRLRTLRFGSGLPFYAFTTVAFTTGSCVTAPFCYARLLRYTHTVPCRFHLPPPFTALRSLVRLRFARCGYRCRLLPAHTLPFTVACPYVPVTLRTRCALVHVPDYHTPAGLHCLVAAHPLFWLPHLHTLRSVLVAPHTHAFCVYAHAHLHTVRLPVRLRLCTWLFRYFTRCRSFCWILRYVLVGYTRILLHAFPLPTHPPPHSGLLCVLPFCGLYRLHTRLLHVCAVCYTAFALVGSGYLRYAVYWLRVLGSILRYLPPAALYLPHRVLLLPPFVIATGCLRLHIAGLVRTFTHTRLVCLRTTHALRTVTAPRLVAVLAGSVAYRVYRLDCGYPVCYYIHVGYVYTVLRSHVTRTFARFGTRV